jgi:hypothetical protein
VDVKKVGFSVLKVVGKIVVIFIVEVIVLEIEVKFVVFSLVIFSVEFVENIVVFSIVIFSVEFVENIVVVIFGVERVGLELCAIVVVSITILLIKNK